MAVDAGSFFGVDLIEKPFDGEHHKKRIDNILDKKKKGK